MISITKKHKFINTEINFVLWSIRVGVEARQKLIKHINLIKYEYSFSGLNEAPSAIHHDTKRTKKQRIGSYEYIWRADFLKEIAKSRL